MGFLIAWAAVAAFIPCVACGKTTSGAADDAGASAASASGTAAAIASAASSAPTLPATSSPTPSATAVAAKKIAAPSAPYSVECRARNEAGLIELALAWDKNFATGTLSVDGKSRRVIAEMYKGLVIVDAEGTAGEVTGKLATVTTDGKKTIRLGDYKQPTFDCN